LLEHCGLGFFSTVSATCKNRQLTVFSLVWQNKRITFAFSIPFFVNSFQIIRHCNLFDFQQLNLRLCSRWNCRPYSRMYGKIKVLRSNFQCFFLLTRFRSKTVRCFLQYFNPFVIVACVTSNSYGYIQDEALDSIIASVEKWMFYARILNTFFCQYKWNKYCNMFFVTFWFLQQCGLRFFSRVSATCKNRQ